MKTLKIIAFTFVFAISSIAFAGTNPAENVEPKTIGQVVGDLLSNPEVNLAFDQDVVVEFEINRKNEIVISSVGTKNFFLKRFIKFRLNYQKIKMELPMKKNNFKILLKFQKLE